MTMNPRILSFGVLLTTLFASTAACGPDPDYALLEGGREGDSVFSRSDLRLRLPNGTIQDVSEATVADFVKRDCEVVAPAAAETLRTCVMRGRDAHTQLCVANRLIEIADDPSSQPLRRYASSSAAAAWPLVGTFADAVVLPAESPQRVALLKEARLAARKAQTEVISARASIINSQPAGCAPSLAQAIKWPTADAGTGAEVLNLDEHLAASAVEALQLITETTEKLVAGGLAAADRRMGDTASPQEIGLRVWVGDTAFAGRYDAAHGVVSGKSGLPGAAANVRSAGMCPGTPLNSSERRALAAIRQSGISPPSVASMPLDPDLLNLMRDRLAVLNSNPRITAPVDGGTAGTLSTATTSQFLEYLGVTAAEIAAARRYLVQENEAFGRSTIAGFDTILPGELQPGTLVPLSSPPSSFTRSAATVLEPTIPDAAYWGALASLPNINFALTTQLLPDIASAPTFPSVTATSLPSGTVVGEDLLLAYSIGALEQAVSDTTSLGPAARSLIASQLSELRLRYRGLVRTCVTHGNVAANRNANLRIYHRMSAPTFALVKGHEGLKCATTGFIDGVRCTMGNFTVGTVDPGDTNDLALPSFGWYRGATVPMASLGTSGLMSAPPTQALMFVVYTETATTTGIGPGAWKVFTGQALTVTPTDAAFSTTAGANATYCVDRPAIEGLDEKVAQILQPSTVNCTQPATSCAGIPSDQRLPLENDLTSDGDPVESSWRHYLDSASAAAAVADELGEELIREGLEQDARLESAVDELAAACGARINLDGVVGAMTVPRTAGACPCSTPGYACVASVCTIDPVALAISRAATDGDAARLRRCLGVDDAAVSLGSETLCAWIEPASGVLCGRAGATTPTLPPECPYAVSRGATACGALPTGYRSVGPTTGLGYFAEDTDLIDPPPAPTGVPPCDALALLRSPPPDSLATRFALLQARTKLIRGSQFWATPVVQAAARRMGWRPLPGDFSEATLDGGRWIRLGSLGGVTVGRPCDNAEIFGIACGSSATADPNTAGSIFCVENLCGTPLLSSATRTSRAAMNDRLARAVIAAKMIAGVPLSGVFVPTYPAFRGADTDGDSWSRFRRATWNQIATLDSRAIYRATNGEIFDQTGETFTLGGSDSAYYVANDGVAPYDQADAEYTLSNFGGSGGTGIEIFDTLGADDSPQNALDSDDTGMGTDYDWNSPLIVRELPEYMSGGNAAPNASLIWGGLNGTALQPSSPRTPSVRIRRLFEQLSRRESASLTTVVLGNGMGLSNYWKNYDDGNDDWYDYVDEAAAEGVNHNFTRNGNRAFIAGGGLTEASVLDAVELICAAQLDRRSVAAPVDIPVIRGVDDLSVYADHLETQSARMQGQAARVIFEGYPRDAIVNADSSGSSTGGTGDGVAADFGSLIATLRTQMNDLADQRRVVALEVSLLSNDVRTLENVLRGISADSTIVDLTLAKEFANQMTECATAVADLGGVDTVVNPGKSVSAGMTCVNSFVQYALSIGIAAAQSEGLAADQAEAINQAESTVRTRSRALGTLAAQIRGSIEQIRGTMTQIKATRARARRALVKALMLDTDETEAEFNVNTTMRRRLNTTAIRYQRAFNNATRQAYIAKLAVEQRLGVPLSSLTSPMRLLDEPPSGWQMDVCSMTGIDYDRIRDSAVPPSGELPDGGLPDGAVPPPFDDYSGQYIGDYVRKLALVMESYPFDYPYAPSSDSTVISLRDEIMHIRTECATPVNNHLYQSGHLDVKADDATGATGWRVEGCPPQTAPDGGVTWRPPGCVSAAAAPPETTIPAARTCNDPFIATVSRGAAQPFDVRFGDFTDPVWPTTTDLRINSRLVQWVTLEPGIYRLSWYSPLISTPVQIRRREAVIDPLTDLPEPVIDSVLSDAVVQPDQAGLPSQQLLTTTCGTAWNRLWRMFQIDRRSEIGIAVDPPGDVDPVTPASYVVAGFMLEDVSSTFDRLPSTPIVPAPPAYVDTGSTLTRALPTCEDPDGSEFRRVGFKRGCSFLCSDGLGEGCTGITAEPRCYWETQFGFTQRQIERGELIRGGGFAYGNFNYRIEDIALNIVGTYTRDCEQARALGYTSSVCYANGTVPYSLYHTGDFTVRNHAGDDYDAPLFNGAIEYARALATEDYITNPISSASASRLEPFRKREFSGRPINGTYTLRIWDDPAVDFSSIDDIQIVMNYRYWTRFGR